MEDLNINFGNLKVDQLGFVFKDIEKQAKIMQSLFGFSKFIFGRPETQAIQYRGKESQLKRQNAFSRLGKTQIELMKWIDGDSSQKEFLDQGKEGLHHIAVYVEDSDAYIEKFHKKGIEIIQSGKAFNVKFTYLDTIKSFGFIVELLEQIRRRKKRNK